MQRDKQRDMLQTIFSFFVGIMLAVFVGVGVNTFYPNPQVTQDKELQELYRQQERLYGKSGGLTPNAATQDEIDELQDQIDEVQQRVEAKMSVWQRNTSIVLILCATIAMAISLVRSEQLRVISNGLLLGGLFTMVYGAGWSIASRESMARFLVISFALAVTLVLGYVKFVRGRKDEDEETPVAAAPPAQPPAS